MEQPGRGIQAGAAILLLLGSVLCVKGLGRTVTPRAYIVDDYRLTFTVSETEMEGLVVGTQAWGVVYLVLGVLCCLGAWWLMRLPAMMLCQSPAVASSSSSS